MEKFTEIVLLILLVVVVVAVAVQHAEGADVDLKVIAQIESGGHQWAHNSKTGATGMYQITPICLQDYAAFHPESHYVIDDMFSPRVAKKIANWYLSVRIPALLRHYGIPVTTRNICYAYNMGCLNVKRWLDGKKELPKETRDYYTKYMRYKK